MDYEIPAIARSLKVSVARLFGETLQRSQAGSGIFT